MDGRKRESDRSPSCNPGGAVAAISIVRTIVRVISAKKHVKNQPYRDRISDNNAVTIINAENVSMEFPLEVYQRLKNRSLDSDLNRIASPLQKDHINAAEITATTTTGESVSERIEEKERKYFEATNSSVTSTKETSLVVKLNSLTKTTLSGYLYLNDGSRAFYHFTGDNQTNFVNLFSHHGLVKARCVAQLDENLKPTRIEILDAERVQGNFNFDTPPEELN